MTRKRRNPAYVGALVVVSFASLGGSACSSSTITHESAALRGERDLDDPNAFSASKFAYFGCTQCHAKTSGAAGARIFPGAPLEGAASRPTFWSGRFDSLHDAIDECVTHFQRGDPLDVSAPHVVDLNAYLQSIGASGPTQAVPFTVIKVTKDLPPGDASRGNAVYDRACRSCHGEPHTGVGKLGNASRIPEDTQSFHGADGPVVVREVVIEKVRTGSFLDFSGQMPPFSQELLSDGDVADVVAFLGLYK